MPPQRLRRVKLSIRLFILANSACRRVGHGGPSIPQIQLPDRLARLHELSPRAMLIFLSTNLLRPAGGPFASCLPAHLMRQCTRGRIKATIPEMITATKYDKIIDMQIKSWKVQFLNFDHSEYKLADLKIKFCQLL